jgi:CO/xanthine dehydrogenase Mo-binding subunit
VVADTKDAAEAAAALVQVEAEPLAAVLSVEDALDPASALVQDPSLRPKDPLANTNVLREWTFGWGNTDGVAPHLIVEHEYRFPMVTHFAIEPHVFIAAPRWRRRDTLDADTASVRPPACRCRRSEVADRQSPHRRPGSRRRLWRKGWPKFEPLLAVLALRLGRPCDWCSPSRKLPAGARTSARIHAKTGFDRDGHIVSQELNTDFLIGAYADIGVRVVSKASYARAVHIERKTRRSPHARCCRTRRRAPRFEVSARRRRRGRSRVS